MKNVKTNQMNARRCNSEGAWVKMTSWLNNNFKLLALTLLAVLSSSVWGATPGTSYTKITDITSLSAGDEVILFCDDEGTGVTGYSSSDATVSKTSSDWIKFEVEKSGDNYYFKDPGTEKYITKQTSNKFTITATTASGNECTVNSNGVICINSRYLCKNSNYYRMYTSIGTYSGVFVYKVAGAEGPAPVGTVLWGENFAHFGTNTPSAAGTGTGTTIYDNASITYTQSSTNTKGYDANLAGGTAPELLLSQSNQTWTISGIKSGDAKEISLTFLSNKTTFSLTCSSDAYTVSGSQKSWTLTLGTGKTAPATFNLTLKNTGSSNARIDDVELTVKTAGGASTYNISYSLDGGTHGTTHPDKGTIGTAFYVSAPTKSGYTFTGWTVTSGLNTTTAKWGTSSTPSTSISSSSTLCVNGATGDVYFKDLGSASVTLTANWQVNKTISSIAVTTSPKTNYTTCEKLVVSDWEVTATYSDTSTGDVTSGCTFSPANGSALTVGSQTVTVTHTASGKTTTKTITVTQGARDTFKDNVQGTADQYGECNDYTIPSCGDKTKGAGCDGEHYKFIGWSSERIQTGEATEPSGLLKAGNKHDADGTTYYAVWAKEAE